MFTNEQLQMMINGQTVGTDYPYNTGDEKEIEKTIKNLFYNLRRSSLIDCDAEFGHYGSGYASFIDIFCFKRNEGSVKSKKFYKKDLITSIEVEGIALYISRLAPVAVFGNQHRWKSVKEDTPNKEEYYSGFSFLSSEDPAFLSFPSEEWLEEFREIKWKIAEAGYTLLNKEYLIQPLPFKANIPTILSIPSRGDVYKVFDALFYWED